MTAAPRRRPARRVAIAAVAAVVTMVALPAPAGAAAPHVEFTWGTPDRFGADADGDGRIDLPNTAEYVHGRLPGSCPTGCGTARFELNLDASETDIGRPVDLYRWRVSGPELATPLTFVSTSPHLSVLLPEGEFRVELAVAAGSATFLRTATVPVDDLLVVAIGDSYASGEGNPERGRGDGHPATWGDGAGDPAVEASHAAAHRSSISWPAMTALELERSDPAGSVTFVTVAASGATVEDGLLGPQEGVAAASQLRQVADIVGDRRIDLLLVSIGGNDIGFAKIVRGLVEADRLFDPWCYRTEVANVLASAHDGAWGRGTDLALDFNDIGIVECRSTPPEGTRLAGLAGLPGELDQLAAASALLLDVGRIVVTEYPDPSVGLSGGTPETCGEIVGDVTPPFRLHEIDRGELERGIGAVLGPLNDTIAAGARRHGWTLVGGIADAFADGHGYCAPWPDYGYPESFYALGGLLSSRADYPEGWFRNPRGIPATEDDHVNWYRTAAQSAALQGPSARFESTGTLHPNELGHLAIARRVLAALRGPA